MSEAVALKILGKLIDRIERQPERQKRVIEPVPKRGYLTEELQALHNTLKRAEAAGAVTLIWGKPRAGTSHLVEKVVLADAGKLYGFLGRRPAGKEAEKAAARALVAVTDWFPGKLPDYVLGITHFYALSWSSKLRPGGLGPEDWPELVEVLKGVLAVKEMPSGALDLRSFSRRTTGESKLIERNRGRIAQQLRRLDQLPDYLESADDVLAHYDLEKFPQPVLVAGALAWRGERLVQEPYVGLAPEVAARVTAAGAVSGILTIENLASFNRHVREARRDGEIVIYSGGFPSRHTLAFIVRLAAETKAPCFHWGDIDLGGIRIAHHLHLALPRGLRLHLMSEALALAHGTPIDPVRASGIPAESPVADLATFLASERAHSLEQEELDPVALAHPISLDTLGVAE